VFEMRYLRRNERLFVMFDCSGTSPECLIFRCSRAFMHAARRFFPPLLMCLLQREFVCHVALLLFFLTSPAHATTPQATVEQLNACVAAADSEACRPHITASSDAVFQRFAALQLFECLPQPVTFASEQRMGVHRVVRVRATVNDAPRHFRLWMAEEEGAWKLDIPASLEASLGKKWQQTVNATEALYTLMQAQLGGNVGCAMLQGMVEDKARSAPRRNSK
jgi:hypothetical protein